MRATPIALPASIPETTITPLPLRAGNQANVNWQIFIQDNVTEGPDGSLYVVWTDPRHVPVIGRLRDGRWEVRDLGLVPGNPLASPVEIDGHNVLAVAVTKTGRIFVAANMHNHPIRMVTSTNFDNWSAVNFPPISATYPQFVKLPNDDLLFLVRSGGSGHGITHLYRWIGFGWTDPVKLIDGMASNPDLSPYMMQIPVGRDGTIHLFWNWRETNMADTNFDVCYAKSTDGGITWRKSNGTPYNLPIKEATAEVAYPTARTASGLVNSNGADVDIYGRPHTAFMQYDDEGFTQYIHLWHDGTAWRSGQVSSLRRRMETVGVPIVDGSIARPTVVCTPEGRTLLLWGTWGTPSQRMTDMTIPGAPTHHHLIRNLGFIEIPFDREAARDRNLFRYLLSRPTTDRTLGPAWIVSVPLTHLLDRTQSSFRGDTDFAYDMVDITPPFHPPKNVRAVSAGPDRITVAWDPVLDDFGKTTYNVYFDGVQRATSFEGTEITVTMLDPMTTYQVEIQARDSANNRTERSEIVSMTTTEVTLLDPTTIPETVVLLDARDTNGNGDLLPHATPLTTWVDKSGKGRTFTGAGQFRHGNAGEPTRYVRFNNGRSMSSAGGLFWAAHGTVIMIAKQPVAQDNAPFAGLDRSVSRYLQLKSTLGGDRFQVLKFSTTGTTAQDTVDGAGLSWKTYRARYNATHVDASLDGAGGYSARTYTPNAAEAENGEGWEIGGGRSGPVQLDVAMLIVINRDLTDTEVVSVERWASVQLGMTA